MKFATNIIVYTTWSNSGSRKIIKFLNENNILFEQKHLGTMHSPKLTKAEVIQLAKLAGGFDEILANRTDLYKNELEPLMDLETTTTNDVVQFIIDNPRILKFPIITDGKKIQAGFNEEDVRVFLPRQLKYQIFERNLRTAEKVLPITFEEEQEHEQEHVALA